MIDKLKCKECTERYVGCHGSCEHYLAWRKEVDALNKKIRNEKWYHELGKPQKRVREKKK